LAGGTPAQQDQVRVSKEHIGRLWDQLAGQEEQGLEAVETLIEMGDKALPDLRRRIRAEHEIDADRVADWIAQLDARNFTLREQATNRLKRLGPAVMPLLRAALKNPASLEVRARLNLIIEHFDDQKPDPGYMQRVQRLARILRKIGSAEALAVAVELAEKTAYDHLRRDVTAEAVGPLSVELYSRHLARAREDWTARRLDEAKAHLDAAAELAERFPGLSGEPVQRRLAYVAHLGKLAARAASLEGPDARRRRALLALAEWQDPAAARKILSPIQAPETPLGVVLAAPDQPDADQAARLAEAYQTLAGDETLSSYARCWLWARAGHHWRTLAERLDEKSDRRKQVETHLDAVQRKLLAMGDVADTIGLENPWGSFSFRVLQANLRSAEGQGNLPDGGTGWLYPAKWRVLGPFAKEWQPGRDSPPMPDVQFTAGPIDFTQTYKIDEKTRRSWQDKTLGPTGWQVEKPERNCSWYYYTEFLAETAGAREMALGFDDTATMWINGKKVYQSDDSPRAWDAEEHVARFAVRRGLNRVLIRLNNAGGATGLSLLLGKTQE
jgi:hypothetical protein